MRIEGNIHLRSHNEIASDPELSMFLYIVVKKLLTEKLLPNTSQLYSFLYIGIIHYLTVSYVCKLYLAVFDGRVYWRASL